MNQEDIKEGVFYHHKLWGSVKVIKKGINDNLIDNDQALVERQMKDFCVEKETSYCSHIVYEIRRKSWDVMPREKEPANFTLKEDYTIPTNTSMYKCSHCEEDNKKHKIKDVPAEGVYLGTWRVCTGCKRKDGVWTPYGDDN